MKHGYDVRKTDHSEPEVFEAMDVDADRRLAFQEFCQGLSLLGMSSAGLSELLSKDSFPMASYT